MYEARTRDFTSNDEQDRSFVLSHIDSLLFYINSGEYGSVPTEMNSTFTDRIDDQSDMVGNIGGSYQDTYSSHTSSEEDQVCLPPRGRDFRNTDDYEDMVSSVKDEGKFEYLSHAIKTAFDSIQDGSVTTYGGRYQFIQKLDNLRAEFSNFYPVEVSLEKKDSVMKIEDNFISPDVTINKQRMSVTGAMANYGEIKHTSSLMEPLQRIPSNNEALYKRSSACSVRAKNMIGNDIDIAECIGVFMETINGILNRLPLNERQGTLEILKRNPNFRKLLQSPQSGGLKGKEFEYFTFNDHDLHKSNVSSDIDVMPLKEIMLHSVHNKPEYENNRIQHESNKSDLNRDSMASTARPGKTRVMVESIYHTGQSCYLFTNDARNNSVIMQNSLQRSIDEVSFKIRSKSPLDHSSNKENRAHHNRGMHSGLSLQEPIIRASKVYLKGARFN